MESIFDIATQSPQEILQKLTTNSHGLSEKEISKRLKKYGANVLVEKTHFVTLKLLLASFASPLVLLLLIASFISSLLGDLKDFFIIFIIVLLSGGITFYQHFKADRASEKLKKKVQLSATVIRDGIKKEIPFSHIVPGDLVFLTAGDIIPADGRIIDLKDFLVDESTLTGESFPSEKAIVLKNENKTLNDLHTIVFAGTHVTSGEATIVITATGKTTQLGQLAHEIAKPKPRTDFDTGIEHLSIVLIKTIVILCIFVFLCNAFIHHQILTSFTFAVALAVGLTPELMPVILTINLSRGALRMEKKEVIVKYLPAIQNMGSMDILCTDKTGTLTENTTQLIDYQSIEKIKSEKAILYGKLTSSLSSGFKDPLDIALLHHEHTLALSDYKKIDELPFDFTRKRSSIIVEDVNKQTLLITKGAPQKVLNICATFLSKNRTLKLSEKDKRNIEQYINSLNQQGLRVLLIASKKVKKESAYENDVEKDLCFVGYLIFQDPVKTTAYMSIRELEKQGISIKILTGDNELVTTKVCNDAHIPIAGILTSEDLDHFSDEELTKHVDNTTIFARLTPEQKARVIQALQKNNHVVGYLGDGVNDAPPLKKADVGISVSNGSDIARDVADIVLMRKSLSILHEGVKEGRKTHANIMKYILMSLSSNLGNMISVAIASIFLPFLPLLPIQILLINFLYDLSQISIPTDHVDAELIQKPQKWDIGFIKKFMLSFGPISSFFDIGTFLVLLYIFHTATATFRTGWFVESIVTQTLIVFAIRTRRIPFIRSLPSIPVIVGALLTLVIGIVLISSKFSSIFAFTKLPFSFYIFLAGIVVFYFITVEVGKSLFYRHNKT